MSKNVLGRPFNSYSEPKPSKHLHIWLAEPNSPLFSYFCSRYILRIILRIRVYILYSGSTSLSHSTTIYGLCVCVCVICRGLISEFFHFCFMRIFSFIRFIVLLIFLFGFRREVNSEHVALTFLFISKCVYVSGYRKKSKRTTEMPSRIHRTTNGSISLLF